jgi:hypothetical protein
MRIGLRGEWVEKEEGYYILQNLDFLRETLDELIVLTLERIKNLR